MAIEINELTKLAYEGAAQPLTTTPVVATPGPGMPAWWADAFVTD